MSRPVQLTEVPAKFWARVDKRGPEECWEWTGSQTRGYGMIWLRNGLIPGAPRSERAKGRMQPATRLAWYLSRGEWPAQELDVCHYCDNPPCVNPAHLWLGTPRENMQDMIRKGRHVYVGAPGGERHPGHKMTDDQVREITARGRAGEDQYELAREFGISQSLVSAYVRGIRRKDITAQAS